MCAKIVPKLVEPRTFEQRLLKEEHSHQTFVVVSAQPRREKPIVMSERENDTCMSVVLRCGDGARSLPPSRCDPTELARWARSDEAGLLRVGELGRSRRSSCGCVLRTHVHARMWGSGVVVDLPPL